MQTKVLEVDRLKSETQQPLCQTMGPGEAPQPLKFLSGKKSLIDPQFLMQWLYSHFYETLWWKLRGSEPA